MSMFGHSGKEVILQRQQMRRDSSLKRTLSWSSVHVSSVVDLHGRAERFKCVPALNLGVMDRLRINTDRDQGTDNRMTAETARELHLTKLRWTPSDRCTPAHARQMNTP